MDNIRIGDREVGEGRPVFVIAEAGINHNGSLDTAMSLVDAAADAGCDAVKFQKRTPRAMLSREAYDKPYKNGGNSYGRTYGQHRERLELGREEYFALHAHARNRGVLFMASAWDHPAVAFLELLDVPAHKIGSPDLTNLPLCAHIAALEKPVFLSTGMSEQWEVEAAVRVIHKLNPRLMLLHCVSMYPAPFEELPARGIFRPRVGLARRPGGRRPRRARRREAHHARPLDEGGRPLLLAGAGRAPADGAADPRGRGGAGRQGQVPAPGGGSLPPQARQERHDPRAPAPGDEDHRRHAHLQEPRHGRLALSVPRPGRKDRLAGRRGRHGPAEGGHRGGPQGEARQ
jgi:hypothetical protein